MKRNVLQCPKHRLIYSCRLFLFLSLFFSTEFMRMYAQEQNQTIADGYYYIANSNGYSSTNTDGNYYMVPSSGEGVNLFYDGEELPYLTTYKTKRDENSIWLVKFIKKEDGYDYYNIIHAIDNKYLTHNDTKTKTKNRLRVHLQSEIDEANQLFAINNMGNISPKAAINDDNKYLNPAGGNKDSYAGQNTTTVTIGGTTISIAGLVGLYKDDEGSRWAFEDAACASPKIVYDENNKTVTISCITDGATIYYTTDGTEPTTESTLYKEPFTPDDDTYIIKAIACKRGDVDKSSVSFYHLKSMQVSSTKEITDMTISYILEVGFKIEGMIGTKENPFRGIIDGQMHVVSGTNLALVDYADGATIKNVILDNVVISGDENVGAICNNAKGSSRIYNCGVLASANSTISGSGYVGGIVGFLGDKSRVVNCFSFANVSGGSERGGIVGYNSYPSKSGDIRTMVMNCMFYGTGSNIAPIYGGEHINNNDANKLNNYNYYVTEKLPQENISKANGALSVEERFLKRFEFYRLLLNSNRELAACYINGSVQDARQVMAKWVLDTSIAPYPILKPQGKYPSIINYDPNVVEEKLGSLPVAISQGSNAPDGAELTVTSLSLIRTGKDPSRYNFNYDKVQLPYYNNVGTGNYTNNKVVTGWEVTVSGGTNNFTTDGYDAPHYNFADRNSTEKDNYETSKRIFAQGAYFDVPTGVTNIEIKPHWATCVYLSDTYYDSYGYGTNNGVEDFDKRYDSGKFNEQTVYHTFDDALKALNSKGRTTESTVYDYAVVLVGNCHRSGTPKIDDNDRSPFTLMSADIDGDNEPDYSMIYNHDDRKHIPPVRFDFLNIISHNMAQNASDSGIRLTAIFRPSGWFEVTNTCLIHFWQFEYDCSGKTEAPLILHGGVYEQIVSTRDNSAAQNTIYIHLGSNVWFKEFSNGCHVAVNPQTKHTPISITGGEYEKLYLTGMFSPEVVSMEDYGECYIDGGKFGEVAGAGQEQLKGNVTWIINHADISNFYGGGINANKPVTGNIEVTINNSNVGTYCGGPKFGNMTEKTTVVTNSEGTTFDMFFGAGYGGTSFYRDKIVDKTYESNNNKYNPLESDWQGWAGNYIRGKYVENKGIAANFEYEFFNGSKNFTVARLYVNYATLSLAVCHDVTSNLKNCKIKGNFYGGGNLGKVDGTVTSTLEDCEIAGNVFGSGFSATPPTVDIMDGEKGAFKTIPYYKSTTGTYVLGVLPDVKTYTWSAKGSTSNTLTDDGDGRWIYTDVDLKSLGQVGNAVLTIKGNTNVQGVYGGGEKSGVNGNVEVNILGGTIRNDVYGGGALANTNTQSADLSEKTHNTIVNLKGGIISGNVYGGGQGDSETEVIVGGNVIVNLNEDVPNAGQKGCVVGGDIFGCNNVNGTPKGSVTVNIYKTQNKDASQISNTPQTEDTPAVENAKRKGNYDLNAVYGGGNHAAYEPTALESKTNVNIYGCDLTSIKTVYGGGNAASTPETHVVVTGTYEIETVFGGGNGKDRLPDGSPNPGANVGYKAVNYVFTPDQDKTEEENELARIEAEKAAFEEQKASLVYGKGETLVELKGGLVHSAYGASNTKGNIRTRSLVMLDENDLYSCPLQIDEVYGAGNMAVMDGKSMIMLCCVSYLKEIYGGAKEADVNGDINMTIQSGSFDKVFGGNNLGGDIKGTITVNIEETGCHPIVIGELYGGGNEAAYTSPIDRQGVTLNVKSFTNIGTVFGGGKGKAATVTGDTHVNINVVKGKFAGQEVGAQIIGGESVPAHTIPDEIGKIGTVFGGGNAANVVGNTNVYIGTKNSIVFETPATSSLEERTKTGVGAHILGNVYGGGKQADVIGKTNVRIGNEH